LTCLQEPLEQLAHREGADAFACGTIADMLRPDIRHVWLDGRYTSLTMEREFWEQFRLITIERRVTVGELLRVIERTGRLQPYRGQSHVLERRREGLRLLTLEMPETAIEAAIIRGFLKPEDSTQAWSVIDSVYRNQLSDRALNWLTDNAVIIREQRTNAAAILRRVSDWLERAAAR
jgi:predicted DNA-binding ribbon-helix-helix protein